MKITIEKDQYEFATSSWKTRSIVYETNEVSQFDMFQIINKALSIISINGKYDWRERMLGEGFEPAPIDKVAPVIYPAGPYPYGFPPPTIPNSAPWTPMQPLVGDPPGWNPSNPTVICSGKTSDMTGCSGIVDPAATKAIPFLSAMTQADGQGDDSGTRGD